MVTLSFDRFVKLEQTTIETKVVAKKKKKKSAKQITNIRSAKNAFQAAAAASAVMQVAMNGALS
jgi:hypothetical protein